jgi:hypothetical protein
MDNRTAVPAAQLLAGLRRLHAAHWANAGCAALLASAAVAGGSPAIAAIAAIAGAVVFAALHARVIRVHRAYLDPCRSVGAGDLADVSGLLDYYADAAAGPEAVRLAWLPPLTGARAVARRSGNPWWAPRANLAYSARLSNARSTVIMPFLVAALRQARDEWAAGPECDAAAVTALRLREAWSDDILRQQGRDCTVQSEAAAAWLLLEL